MRSEMREKTKNVHWQRDKQFAATQPKIELGQASITLLSRSELTPCLLPGLNEDDHKSQEISFSMVIARLFNVVIGLEGERSKHFWDIQMPYAAIIHNISSLVLIFTTEKS